MVEETVITFPLMITFKKLNKTDKPLTRLIKKKMGGPRSIKSEMKKERLQQTPQKYKGS